MRQSPVSENEQATQMLNVLQLFLDGQLALTKLAALQMARDLANLFTAAFDQQLEPDLVADGIERRLTALEGLAFQGEKAGHRVLGIGEGPGHQGGDLAIQPAKDAPL